MPDRSVDLGLKHSFTMVELMVVFAILAILISLLQPSLKSIQDNSDNVLCQNNLKSIANATQMYYQDHDGWLPVSHGPGGYYLAWPIELSDYLGLNFTNHNTMVAEGTVVECPSHNFRGYENIPAYLGGYGFNHSSMGWTTHPAFVSGPDSTRQKIYTVTKPEDTIYITDSLDYNPNYIGNTFMLKYSYRPTSLNVNLMYDRHQGDFNVFWLDFSVRRENWFDLSAGRHGDVNWYYHREK